MSIFNPWVMLGFVLVLAGSNAVTAWKSYDWGYSAHKAETDAAALRQAKQAVAKTRAGQDAVNKASGVAEVKVEHIRDSIRIILQKVPVHVTPAIDRRYRLPLALVRLYDESAAGTADVPAISTTTGQPDDAPAPVTTSDATSVLVANNGSCNETRERMIGLQNAWRDALAAVNATP